MSMNNLDELSPEGQEMWEKMDDPDFIIDIMTESPKKKTVPKREVKFIVEQLTLMKENSEIVVKEALKKKIEYVKLEQYFKANEQNVAVFIHRNFIERIDRILQGLPAFKAETKEKKNYIE